MKIYKLFFLLILLNLSSYTYSQDYSTTNKKAIQYFEKALIAFDGKKRADAAELAYKALAKDENFVEPYLLLGEIAYDMGNEAKQIEFFSKAVEIDGVNYPMAYYLLALTYIETENYSAAKKNFSKFLDLNVDSETFNTTSSYYIEICDFRINAVLDPVEFKPEKLPATINSENGEYFPSISADGKTLLFTRLLPTYGKNPVLEDSVHEDIFVSYLVDNKWTEAVSVGSQINDINNQGAHTISADGTIMIYTDCTCSDGLVKCCDLYLSEFVDSKWTSGSKLGEPINTSYFESQPSISADGKTIFFVSNRQGGKGKRDIWKVIKFSDGTWSGAINLGDSINTSGNEMCPFLHADNKTFYFSSDGLPGMGGLDFFRSEIDENKKFSTPVNLGYPINSSKNEFRLILDAKGEVAYFSTSRETEDEKEIYDSYGRRIEIGQDIYKFELYPQMRPTKTLYVKGNIFDANTTKSIEADYDIINLETTEKVNADKNANHFFICLPIEQNYALNVSKPGYLFYSENFSLINLPDSIDFYILEVPLIPIQSGGKIILKNIFFETDSYNLKQESYVELNKLVEFLNLNSELNIEIGGHTDNIGTEQYNKVLSENRAKSVVEYLILKGINTKRLTYKGYGFSEPLTDNNTETGRAQNRRTEFKIIK